MSPERQATGQMMQMAGALEIMGGAVQVGLAASGLAWPGGGARVVATHTQGEITLEVLENGVVRGTHAAYPGKSIVMQPNGSFRALDELGNVVGTGVVGPGGSQSAAAEAWGTGSVASSAGNPAPGSPSFSTVPSAGASPVAGGSSLARVPPSMSTLPEVSPFYTGGARAGALPPNQYNPCGRGDNCGFTSMSYARQVQDPSAPMSTADDLYLQRLQQLGIPVDDNLSRQLVFPERSYEGLRPRPGYGPLFDDNGGNRLSEYTLPSTARALGIPGTEANDALVRWESAFGRHASIEEAVEARAELLEESRRQSVDPTAVRQWIETQRADLPGLYIVGSPASAHYMTITIEPSGRITGFDPQNIVQYETLAAVQGRMGRDGFTLMYKVTLPLPPAGETR
jgi:hypothetical protein